MRQLAATRNDGVNQSRHVDDGLAPEVQHSNFCCPAIIIIIIGILSERNSIPKRIYGMEMSNIPNDNILEQTDCGTSKAIGINACRTVCARGDREPSALAMRQSSFNSSLKSYSYANEMFAGIVVCRRQIVVIFIHITHAFDYVKQR